jgi:hypothetical protein
LPELVFFENKKKTVEPWLAKLTFSKKQNPFIRICIEARCIYPTLAAAFEVFFIVQVVK